MFFFQKKNTTHSIRLLARRNWHNLLDLYNFLVGRTLDPDYRSESKLVEVNPYVGHPLLMLEVGRPDCHMESEWGTF